MAAPEHGSSCSRNRDEPRAAAGGKLPRPRLYATLGKGRMWRLPRRLPALCSASGQDLPARRPLPCPAPAWHRPRPLGGPRGRGGGAVSLRGVGRVLGGGEPVPARLLPDGTAHARFLVLLNRAEHAGTLPDKNHNKRKPWRNHTPLIPRAA